MTPRIAPLSICCWLVLAPCAPAHAEPPQDMPGPVVHAQGHTLSMIVRQSADAVVAYDIADTGPGAIARIEVQGGAVLIEKTGKQVLWTRLPGTEVAEFGSVESLPCHAPARLSTHGERLACTGEHGHVLIFQLGERPGQDPGQRGARRVLVRPQRGQPSVELVNRNRIAASGDGGVWSEPIVASAPARPSAMAPARARPLTPHTGHSHLRIAPNGKRAVAVYPLDEGHGQSDDSSDANGRDAIHALYTFKLDGKGNRRRLMKHAIPVAWSRDSKWLLVQRGSRACVVRAVGGQYKCWRGFVAIDISADGGHLLLYKPGKAPDADADADADTDASAAPDEPTSDEPYDAGYRKPSGIVAVRDSVEGNDESDPEALLSGTGRLYIVPTGGVRPDKPALLIEGVDGPAAWQ